MQVEVTRKEVTYKEEVQPTGDFFIININLLLQLENSILKLCVIPIKHLKCLMK